jgi:hypothetical protein
VFIVKYFLYVGLALLGVIWGVGTWIGAPAPQQSASQSHIVTALKQFAHRGEGSPAYQYAIRERAQTSVASANTADDALANDDLAKLARVTDSHAGMTGTDDANPAPAKQETAAQKPPVRHKRVASKSRASSRNHVAQSRSRRAPLRMVENAPFPNGGFFTLFR